MNDYRYRTNARERHEHIDSGNCVYSGGELLRLNTLDHSVVERWERLESFDNVGEVQFEFWRDARQNKGRAAATWQALGFKDATILKPFDALGGAEPVNADVSFTHGRDDHGRAQVWRRMQRSGKDPSPLVRIYALGGARENAGRALVFWKPDEIKSCEQFNQLMGIVRDSLKELGAHETLREGRRG